MISKNKFVSINKGDGSPLIDKSYFDGSLFPFLDIILYFNGEFKLFDTFSLGDSFCKSLGLKVDVDYEVVSGSGYLKLGFSGLSGGSNFLKFTDFPSFKIPVKNDYGSQLVMTESPSGTAVASLFAYSGNGKNNRNVFVENVNNSQSQFMPLYREVFVIKFLRNIKVGDLYGNSK